MRKYFGWMSSPIFTLRFNITCFILTIALLPASMLLGWLNSVPFVSVLSVVALQLSCLAAVVASLGLKAQHDANTQTPADGRNAED